MDNPSIQSSEQGNVKEETPCTDGKADETDKASHCESQSVYKGIENKGMESDEEEKGVTSTGKDSNYENSCREPDLTEHGVENNKTSACTPEDMTANTAANQNEELSSFASCDADTNNSVDISPACKETAANHNGEHHPTCNSAGNKIAVSGEIPPQVLIIA